MNKLIPILLLLLSCSSSKTNNEEARRTDSIVSNISNIDSGKIQMENRRKELQKIGHNYSSKIVSNKKIHFYNRELTFVQDLLDSSDHVKGKLYVQLFNDSSFFKLYVLDGEKVKYFIGDSIYTNRIDTMSYGNDRSLPFQFGVRYKNHFSVYLPGSDLLTIHYYDKQGYFDFFRTP
jgi:hypothetical protein